MTSGSEAGAGATHRRVAGITCGIVSLAAIQAVLLIDVLEAVIFRRGPSLAAAYTKARVSACRRVSLSMVAAIAPVLSCLLVARLAGHPMGA